MALNPRSAKRRFIARSAAFVVIVSIAVVFAAAGADRLRVRYDLTATRQHALAPRTERVLDRLSGDYEIAVVADFARVSPLARSAVDDVLSEFVRAAPEIRITRIDAGRADQEGKFVALLDRLAARYSRDIVARKGALDSAAESIRRTIALLSDAAASIADASAAADPGTNARGALEQLAATVRIRIREAEAAASSVASLREQTLLGSSLVPLDRALAAARSELESLAADSAVALKRIEAASESDAAQRASRALAMARDESAAAHETLSTLPPSELYAVVRAIESDNAVVVFSETGVTAVAFSALFPAGDAAQIDDRGVAEFRFVGEELLATAIAALEETARPIVVLTHPWPVRLLDAAGAPNPDAGPLSVAGLVDRMRLRGIDAAEWPVGDVDAAPSLSTLNPSGDRPVIYAALGTVATGQDGALRNAKLATAIEELVEAGERVLLSYSPSALPGAGSPDILARPLEPLGITIDTGRPLIRERRTPRGVTADPGLTLTGGASEHPIAEAINGLTTRLGWVSPIDVEDAPGVATWPILRVEDAADIWAESQWIDLWASSSSARRRQIAPEPTPGLDDLDGPWTVALAAQRAHPADGGELQRLVVVGATAWFFDASILPARRVDGRVAAAFPGNGELFDASIAWLADQDELIAPGAVARDVPRVEAIDPSTLALIRWSLAIGPALAVLLLGGAVRIMRR